MLHLGSHLPGLHAPLWAILHTVHQLDHHADRVDAIGDAGLPLCFVQTEKLVFISAAAATRRKVSRGDDAEEDLCLLRDAAEEEAAGYEEQLEAGL